MPFVLQPRLPQNTLSACVAALQVNSDGLNQFILQQVYKAGVMTEKYQEVIFERSQIGNIMRMVAIDPVSGTEVVVQGPANGSVQALQNVALAKLRYVMKKQQS